MVYDYIIKNGFVVDGSGYPGLKQDIAIKDGKIAKIAASINEEAKQSIDATGRVVTPGFIDAHSHSDLSLFHHAKALGSVRQGITTVMTGQCGSSAAPYYEGVFTSFGISTSELTWDTVDEYFHYLEHQGIGINMGMLVGQGTIRGKVMGTADRETTPEELAQMKALVRDAMEDGAYGISSGRRYMPGCLADEAEVIALCKVAADYDGIYMSHIYNQDAKIMESIADLIEVGRQAKLKVQLVHQKVCGKPYWGQVGKVAELMENARKEGIDILSDAYPYPYTQVSSMDALFPAESLEGGWQAIQVRWLDPVERKKILLHIQDFAAKNPVRAESIKKTGVIWCLKTKDVEGLSYGEIADRWHTDLFNMFIDLYLQNEGHVRTAGIMSEEDIHAIFAHDYVMVGTDSLSYDGKPHSSAFAHARNFGTYPYVFEHFVGEEKLLTLEKAVYKMTGMPARRFNLSKRGLLKEGYAADVVLLDLNTIADQATIPDPNVYPKGIDYVWVNGQLTWAEGRYYEV